MKKYFPYLLSWLFIFVLACGNMANKEPKPEPFLTYDEMVELMADMQVAEAIVKLQINLADTTAIHADSLFSGVFQKHGIDREIFEKNFDWYAQDHTTMEEIYNTVIEVLSERQANLKGTVQAAE